jgi:hypothetical protein
MKLLSRKKIIVLIICLAICGLVGYMAHMYLRWANSPVSQTIQTTNTKENLPTTDTKVLKTKVFETKILANYRVRQDKQQTPDAVTHTNAFEPVTNGKQLAITTGVLPAGGIQEIADYKYRLTYPNIYKKTTVAGFSDGAAFQTAQGELTVVMIHEGTYAILSVTNPKNTIDTTKDLLETVRQNWVWL